MTFFKRTALLLSLGIIAAFIAAPSLGIGGSVAFAQDVPSVEPVSTPVFERTPEQILRSAELVVASAVLSDAKEAYRSLNREQEDLEFEIVQTSQLMSFFAAKGADTSSAATSMALLSRIAAELSPTVDAADAAMKNAEAAWSEAFEAAKQVYPELTLTN